MKGKQISTNQLGNKTNLWMTFNIENKNTKIYSKICSQNMIVNSKKLLISMMN